MKQTPLGKRNAGLKSMRGPLTPFIEALDGDLMNELPCEPYPSCWSLECHRYSKAPQVIAKQQRENWYQVSLVSLWACVKLRARRMQASHPYLRGLLSRLCYLAHSHQRRNLTQSVLSFITLYMPGIASKTMLGIDRCQSRTEVRWCYGWIRLRRGDPVVYPIRTIMSCRFHCEDIIYVSYGFVVFGLISQCYKIQKSFELTCV